LRGISESLAQVLQGYQTVSQKQELHETLDTVIAITNVMIPLHVLFPSDSITGASFKFILLSMVYLTTLYVTEEISEY
jgi:hypothetical protein